MISLQHISHLYPQIHHHFANEKATFSLQCTAYLKVSATFM